MTEPKKTRVQTAHSESIHGPSLSDQEKKKKKPDWNSFARLWGLVWLFVLVLLHLFVMTFSNARTDLSTYFKYMSIGCAGSAALLIYGSFNASHKAVQPAMTYVQGLGTMQDISDAKKRAFKLSGPSIGFIPALVFLILYLIF